MPLYEPPFWIMFKVARQGFSGSIYISLILLAAVFRGTGEIDILWDEVFMVEKSEIRLKLDNLDVQPLSVETLLN